MGLKIQIVDGSLGQSAKLHKNALGAVGLIVFTEDHIKKTDSFDFATNTTQGSDMNVAAVFSGTTIGIHNGIDNVYWTGSAVAGSWTFNDNAQARTGAQSVDGTSATNGSIAQFAKGSDQSLSAHVGFSGWIYLTSFSATLNKELLFYGYDTGTGLQIGSSFNIFNQIDTTLFNTWQQYNVLFSDLNLSQSTIDAIRIELISPSGPAPNFFLDDVAIEELGGPSTFEYKVPIGEMNTIGYLRLVFGSSVNTDHTDGTVPFIEYNDFFGLGVLSKGIIIKIIRNEKEILHRTFTTVGSLLEWPMSHLTDIISSGSTTFAVWETTIVDIGDLQGSRSDRVEIVIQDDFSSLGKVRAIVGFKKWLDPTLSKFHKD